MKTLKDLGQTVNYGSPNKNLVPFPSLRVNLSYINVFSGGALTQDSTTFDVSSQLIKVLHIHTLAFGGEVERSRIDVDDSPYTPGDNTFSAQQIQARAGTTLPAGLTSSGDPFASFYAGCESSFFDPGLGAAEPADRLPKSQAPAIFYRPERERSYHARAAHRWLHRWKACRVTEILL